MCITVKVQYGVEIKGWFTRNQRCIYEISLWKSINKEVVFLRRDEDFSRVVERKFIFGRIIGVMTHLFAKHPQFSSIACTKTVKVAELWAQGVNGV